MRAWVVEDDPEWRALVVAELEYHGACVRGFGSVEALYRELAVDRCDILVLDVGLPGEDGLSATGHLRRLGNMGIVLVTGRGGTADMAQGLSMGADIYLSKPLDLEVLVAALHSLCRRMGLPAAPDGGVEEGPNACWSLAAGGWELRAPEGRSLALTATERRLLGALFAAPGEALARERLVAAVSDEPGGFDPRRLDLTVHRLRARVRDATGAELPLRTVRGVGYILTG